MKIFQAEWGWPFPFFGPIRLNKTSNIREATSKKTAIENLENEYYSQKIKRKQQPDSSSHAQLLKIKIFLSIAKNGIYKAIHLLFFGLIRLNKTSNIREATSKKTAIENLENEYYSQKIKRKQQPDSSSHAQLLKIKIFLSIAKNGIYKAIHLLFFGLIRLNKTSNIREATSKKTAIENLENEYYSQKIKRKQQPDSSSHAQLLKIKIFLSIAKNGIYKAIYLLFFGLIRLNKTSNIREATSKKTAIENLENEYYSQKIKRKQQNDSSSHAQLLKIKIFLSIAKNGIHEAIHLLNRHLK